MAAQKSQGLTVCQARWSLAAVSLFKSARRSTPTVHAVLHDLLKEGEAVRTVLTALEVWDQKTDVGIVGPASTMERQGRVKAGGAYCLLRASGASVQAT